MSYVFFAPSALRRAAASSLALAGFSSAFAVTINYDGTDPSLVVAHPKYTYLQTIYPGTSLTNNQVNITGGELPTSVEINGGFGYGVGAITGNTVVFSQDSTMAPINMMGDVNGGCSDFGGAVTNNTVVIKSGTVGDNKSHWTSVNGGFSFNEDGVLSGNSVRVEGGTVQASFLRGGFINSGGGTATNNTVEISGGTVEGYIIGAASNKGAAIGNSLLISGGGLSLDRRLWLARLLTGFL